MIRLYRKRARHYDLSANLYYLIGFQEGKYRMMAIAALGLRPGDTVVEIGLGER
jgi:demethylmenaquinone methyltransferase/2-methoxy-6-polyprenyl-1,4-benzoquinol methylase